MPYNPNAFLGGLTVGPYGYFPGTEIGYGSDIHGAYGYFWSDGGDGSAAGPNGTGNVGEGMAAAVGGAISNTKIPISWGDRRIYGKVVDHIVKALDPATGIGAETLCISAGEPVFKDVPNDLYKILSGSTVLYDETQGGIVHPAVDSVTWYDGTSDDQPQDPLFVAKFGADVVPGYVGQMIAVIDFNTYQPWNGTRPEPFTIFIQDAFGGKKYRPWGGTWDATSKGSNLNLTDGDRTATNFNPSENDAAMVRGTVGRSSGRRYFEFVINAWGGASGGSPVISNWRWGFLGPSEPNWEVGAMGSDGHSLAVEMKMHTFTDGFFSMKFFTCPLVVGGRYGVAVDLDLRHYWTTTDGVNWFGHTYEALTTENGPILGHGGMPNLKEVLEDVLYLGWMGWQNGDSITTYTTAEDFTLGPPVPASGTDDAETRDWGQVFVELAKLSNLDPNHIVVQNITAGSVGGIIYDGFAWTDVVSNAGKIENIDWWEDGQDIYIRQTANDNPATDVASIPTSHRYIIDDNAGATDAQRGGERRKPVVYSIGYYDVSRQFQESFMMARSEAFQSVREEKLSTPFVMTATEAATRSAIALGKTEMEFEEHHHELPPMVPYIRLRPADIVEFTEEGKAFKTKVSNWTLETDWTIKTSYRKLFTTATNPIVPFDSEIIDASMPAYVLAGELLFNEPSNSGLWALFEDI